MRTTRSRLYKWMLAGLIVLAAVGGVIGYRIRQTWKSAHVFVHTRPIKTSFGWGYEILVDDTIYIHQEFIPAVPGRHGFRSPEDAVKTGRKIIDKMKHSEGEAITVGELLELGVIDSLPVVSFPTREPSSEKPGP